MPKGPKHWITPEQKAKIVKLVLEDDVTTSDAARRFGLVTATVSKIVTEARRARAVAAQEARG